MSSWHGDFIFGWRQIRKNKIVSAAAILSLGLAMGACTAAFRLIDALLLRPLPIAQPDRLYALSRQGFIISGRATTYDGWPYRLFREMRAAVKNPGDLIAISHVDRVDLILRADQELEKAHVQYVSGCMFASFGLRPAVGRLLSESDDLHPGAHPVAVLSNDYWVRRFARDPQVVGRTFRLGNVLYQIVGVAGPGFTGTEPGTVIDIFMPAMMHWGIAEPNWTVFRAFVHLRPGFAAGPFRERLYAALRALNEDPKTVLVMQSAGAGASAMQGDFLRSLITLGLLVALVLLVACVNVANLMAAQATARMREMALRVSVGAGRWRLIRLVLVEGVILASLSAVIGGLFARWAAPWVVGRINPPDNPVRLSLTADWRMLGFALALTFGVTLLFGMLPALRASAVEPMSALKGGANPHFPRRSMRTLVVIQTAFCFVVLFVADLFMVTFHRLSHEPTGFSSERLLNVDVVTQQREPAALWDQVTERLRTVPGVEAIAYADWPLLDGYSFKFSGISIDGAAPADAEAWFLNVSPRWLDAMKIPLIDGRDFRPSDLSPGAAIVNEAFARQYFEGKNPIGKWFEGTSGYMRGQRFQIVGLVRDARYRYMREPALPAAYTPFHRLDAKGTFLGGTFVVRTSSPDPLAIASILRREIPRARPEFRVSTIRSEAELIRAQTVRERLLATLALFFAGVALLLAGVGLYGVLDYFGDSPAPRNCHTDGNRRGARQHRAARHYRRDFDGICRIACRSCARYRGSALHRNAAVSGKSHGLERAGGSRADHCRRGATRWLAGSPARITNRTQFGLARRVIVRSSQPMPRSSMRSTGLPQSRQIKA